MYKYLGHGTYGCVIEPYIPCNNKKIKNKKVKYISKIFKYKSEWEEEIEKNKLIKKEIDPKHKFTVQLISFCDLTEKEFNIKQIDNYEKCNFNNTTSDNENNYQIIYEYGGVDISKVFKLHPNIDIYKFMKSFINIFEGIVILDKKKYVHGDIYIKNIIFNIDTYKSKLIDFGFLVKVKDIYSKENLSLIYQSYRYFPPEYNSFFIRNYTNLNTYIYIDYLYKYMSIMQRSNNYIQKLYKDILYDIKKNHMSIMIRKNEGIKGNEDKINVYMLGLCLFETIILMVLYKNEEQLKEIPIDKICELIKQMVYINPEKRISSKKALDIYKELFNS